jgi:magnesium transporter
MKKSAKPTVPKKGQSVAGLPPGAPVYVGEPRTEPVTISCLHYSRGGVEEHHNLTPTDCGAFIGKPEVTWININGIHDSEIISHIGEVFGLHPLVVEDIMNTEQRPKMEDHGDSIFMVVKMLEYNEAENDIHLEQLSIVLTSDYILTFQENSGDIFDTIRERIRSGKGRIRSMGTDYLAY